MDNEANNLNEKLLFSTLHENIYKNKRNTNDMIFFFFIQAIQVMIEPLFELRGREMGIWTGILETGTYQ